MAVSDTYLDYVRDLLAWLPGLRIRRMFGGAGLYDDDRFFAIAVDGELYLKADAESLDVYRQDGGEQFVYTVKGEHRRLNFWSVPAEIQEDPERLRHWVQLATAAAQRAKK